MDAIRALHRAAEDGDLAMAERLLRADPYLVASREEFKQTPLHRAAKAGHAALVTTLLDHTAEVEARDYGGGTALHGAAAQGHGDAAAALLNRRADANARDQQGLTPLHHAARGGHEAVMALLLARGAEANARGQFTGTPLHEAAEHGHPGAVALLLAHGALANVRSAGSHAPWTPWHAARQAGHGAIADLLRDHGGQDKADSALSIHRAAEAGYLGRLKALVTQDPSLVSSRDFLYRRTPLHWAANNGHLQIAEYLLAHGADPGVRDKAGDTPLARARAMDRPDMADLLLNRGAKA